MTAPIVSAQYQSLEQIAQGFQQEAERIQMIHTRLAERVQRLQNGGWLGENASDFFRDMEAAVFPAVNRLHAALARGSVTAIQIARLLQQADEDAASQLTGDGGQAGGSGTPVAHNMAQQQPPTGPDSSGGFHIGPPTRPNITHDNGFTEFCAANSGHADCSTSASPGDYLTRAKYEAMLRGAQTLGHLDDGTDAYSHYLYGDGSDWNFSYSEYINEDANGRTGYNNIMLEAQRNAEVIGQGRTNFSMTSDAFAIGSGNDPRFPYPSTENWQKAIGGHQVWTSSDVTVTTNAQGQREYTMAITYHAEDRYNFNPGAADIASGAMDRENGRFEVLGWANPFMSYGETTTTVTWTEGDIPGSQFAETEPARRDDRNESGGDRRGEIGDR